MGGYLKGKRIAQSRNYLDPDKPPILPFDYEFIYPITVYDAIFRTMEEGSTSLTDELTSIYRLINEKQPIIEAGTPGHLMTWTGNRGAIGAKEVVKLINPDPAKRSHEKIPTEKAVGDLSDSKASILDFNQHISNSSVHLSDIERSRWNSMAPLSSLESHIRNTTLHITDTERGRWNGKANQTELDQHIYDTNNPHHVTAHQAGTYSSKEIDDMFKALRETFFNYLNISWDERVNQADLVEYHPANWNPNYVLAYGEQLPDVPDQSLIYFALKPSTDYTVNETDDAIIYIKRPGLMWQEVGSRSMNAGDMIIRYPNTTMFVWIQGRFIRLFADNAGGDESYPGSGVSDQVWKPYFNSDGLLAWILAKATEAPDPMDIKGKDGYTPVKGVDYFDGVDGKGVAVGGTISDVLVKLSDENFDTTWKSLKQIFLDMVLAGDVLPPDLVLWDNIKNRPVWYTTLGPNDDGFITQGEVTRQLENVRDKISEIVSKIEGPMGMENIYKDLHDHLQDFNNPHRLDPEKIGAASVLDLTNHIQNFNNPHNVNAQHVGLGKVNNTSDKDKPISDAVQKALDDLIEKLQETGKDVGELNYISNVLWDKTKFDLKFFYRNNTDVTFHIPVAELLADIKFDNNTKELVILLPDGNEHRIDINALIQIYTGHVGTHVDVVVESNNIIKASLIPNSITGYELIRSIHLRESPTTTTQPVGDNSTRIATTEFVKGQVIDNLISYEVDRPLSANMGRILNLKKADIDEVIQIITDLKGIDVIDNLDSTNIVAALSANMGRYLDLTKAPRVHTSPDPDTFGRATIALFGHSRASEVDPLMDGTVFKGTDDGYFARGDHRHPTDITRAPIHSPEFTGEPKTPTPPDDSNDERIANTEWVRRNAVGVSKGYCVTAGNNAAKVAYLKSDFMEEPVFLRQTGSSVVITFDFQDISNAPTLDVQDSGPGRITFGGKPIVPYMIEKGHSYLFTWCGISNTWKLINPSGIHTLPDDDNSNRYVSSEWVRRNAVGTSFGRCVTATEVADKYVRLESDFMSDPVFFLRQKGSSVAVLFQNEDRSGHTLPTRLNVQGSGWADVLFGGFYMTNGMLGKNHTHHFVFDGKYWQLINPVPGTGLAGKHGPGLTWDGSEPDTGTGTPTENLNRLTGYSGVSYKGDGLIDDQGQVSYCLINISYEERLTDVDIIISQGAHDFSCAFGNGKQIRVYNPIVLNKSRTGGIVQFQMEDVYPQGSPCNLVYNSSTASIIIDEKL